MKPIYVCEYGCIDFENNTFCYITDELERAMAFEKQEFINVAAECDTENFKVETGQDDNGTRYVHLIDDRGLVIEWKDFTVAKIQHFGA